MPKVENIKTPLYDAIKLRSRALKRLADFEEYTYRLYMSRRIRDIPKSELVEVDNAMITEKECIRLCDLLLKTYLN